MMKQNLYDEVLAEVERLKLDVEYKEEGKLIVLDYDCSYYEIHFNNEDTSFYIELGGVFKVNRVNLLDVLKAANVVNYNMKNVKVVVGNDKEKEVSIYYEYSLVDKSTFVSRVIKEGIQTIMQAWFMFRYNIEVC